MIQVLRVPIEIRLRVKNTSSDLVERWSAFEDELLRDPGIAKAADFEGNSIGGGEFTLYFVARRDISGFLRRIQEQLTRFGLTQGAEAAIGDSPDDQIRLSLHETLPQDIQPPKRQPAARVGNYYAVPLGDGRWTYVAYVQKEAGYGDFIQGLQLFTDGRIETDLRLVSEAPPAFSPILAAVSPCAKRFGWVLLGNKRLERRPLMFRSSLTAEESGRRPGTYNDWRLLVIGEHESLTFLGQLPAEYRDLEFFRVWLADEHLADRLRTGCNPDKLLL